MERYALNTDDGFGDRLERLSLDSDMSKLEVIYAALDLFEKLVEADKEDKEIAFVPKVVSSLKNEEP
jgi:hypothetical protein